MTRPPELWDGIVRRLAERVPAHEVDAWLRPLHATRDGSAMRILCPSALHRDRVRSRYLEPIRAAAAHEVESEEPIALHVEVGAARPATPVRPNAPVVACANGVPARRDAGGASVPDAGGASVADAGGASVAAPNAVPAARRAPRTAPAPAAPRRLRRAVQQSFETFEVGPTNALAREAAWALASATQREVNPLYLAGDAGQGKTHLARSIVGLARREAARVVYTSAEGFTSEFLGALRSRALPGFKRRYREDCDVLVLEDVDFLPGKETTQLELFHTVSHLLDAGARVVFTGAKLPRAIGDLDRRLGGQMSSGLVAEIAPPDTDLRRRILRARAAGGGVRLPDDCLERLVEAVQGSVRDLESVLGQVVASATLLKRPIDRELVDGALRKLGPGIGAAAAARPVAPREVIEMVAAFFGTTPEALASRSRRRDVLVPRQLAMYLCRRFTDASFSEIGRTLGRDHPSVRNAVAAMERQILERAPLRYQVEALSDRLAHLRSGG
jgi:chromosomal replication initiator protein